MAGQRRASAGRLVNQMALAPARADTQLAQAARLAAPRPARTQFDFKAARARRRAAPAERADGPLAGGVAAPARPTTSACTWPALALAHPRPTRRPRDRRASSAAQALHAHLFGWAENLVQAALKAVPLGQLAGQRILQALVERMPALVAAALALPEDDWQAFSPMLAIASAQHETQYSRLFRS